MVTIGYQSVALRWRLVVSSLVLIALGAGWITAAGVSITPPPAHGYYTLKAPGAALPSGATCANQIAAHHSAWEPRPSNAKANSTMPNLTKVHQSFATRPRSTYGTYDPRWDSYLLPRVTGHDTGTTDEIIQWAACKWGLPDNVLRAIAVRESTWFQYETTASGACVTYYGCGDFFSSEPFTDRKTFCAGLAGYGHDYQADYGSGYCPKTFSIAGEMSWSSPSWGFDWAGNQNGTFPFNRNSTAFALDYLGAHLRGCYNGWEWWLNRSGGDLWGCVGSWYAGNWHSAAADEYIVRVKGEISTHRWLQSSWPTERP
jgi:hypothetical protein